MNFKERYGFKTNGMPKKEAVIVGDKYRITVLTPSLIRLEYSDSSDFENRATQSVINRDFPVPAFEVRQCCGNLVLETERLILTYNKGAFSGSGLKIEVKEI